MTTHHPSFLPGLPPRGLEITLLSLGEHFDAVKVPLEIGHLAWKLLADHSGAVIEETFGKVVYWLVEPGAADSWTLPHVTVLGVACYLAVPPAHYTEGTAVRWLVPCEAGRILTDPGHLHRALATVVRTLGTS